MPHDDGGHSQGVSSEAWCCAVGGSRRQRRSCGPGVFTLESLIPVELRQNEEIPPE